MQTRTVKNSVPLKLCPAGHLILKQKRGYFTGKASKKTHDGASETFNIESVICGDGQRGANGLSLRNLVIYASDRIDGGIESYYEVEADSLMFTTGGGIAAGIGIHEQ